MSKLAASNSDRNPFPATDPEQRVLWEMLVERDFVAFLAADWSMMANDFWAEGFCGIDAGKSSDPMDWKISFPTVESYRDEWLRQAAEFQHVKLAEIDKLDFLFACVRLERIEIIGDRALAHKKFNGAAKTVTGENIELRFQSLFQLIRINGRWKIAGFVGYMPNPMGAKS
jgi:hypothetical protein